MGLNWTKLVPDTNSCTFWLFYGISIGMSNMNQGYYLFSYLREHTYCDKYRFVFKAIIYCCAVVTQLCSIRYEMLHSFTGDIKNGNLINIFYLAFLKDKDAPFKDIFTNFAKGQLVKRI